jgi:hypothetical protein
MEAEVSLLCPHEPNTHPNEVLSENKILGTNYKIMGRIDFHDH